MSHRSPCFETGRKQERRTEMMELDSHFLAFGSLGDLHDPFSFDEDSPMSSEASTGYLQDAVAEWSEKFKRRRMVSSCDFDPLVTSSNLAVDGFWGSGSGNLDSLFQDSSTVSDGMRQSISEEETEQAATKAQQEVTLFSSPSSSSYENYSIILPKKKASIFSIMKKEEENMMRKVKKKKLAYPFAVLKPTGLREGDVTLAEINERILMRPRRPVKHPVGEFACIPCVLDAHGGPGLSGKAVVGLTRIHTQGRGTITIIRTRG